MRRLAILAAAAGLAALVPTVAPAAELDLPRDGCERGQVWNGYRCEWARPRVSEAPSVYREAPPVYRAEPDYESYAEYEEAPVYFARPAYVGPPVYVAPFYRAPVVSYYAGPRYVWGHGHHRRWR